MSDFAIIGNVLEWKGLPVAVLLVPDPAKGISYTDHDRARKALTAPRETVAVCPDCGIEHDCADEVIYD